MKESFLKKTFKNIKKSLFFFALAFIILTYTLNKIKPENETNQVYLNLNNVEKLDPNLNESDLEFFNKDVDKYILDKNVILYSNFTPLYKYLSIPQIEVLRKYTIFYVLQYIEEDKNSIFFKFNYNKINITNIKNFYSGTYNNGIIISFPINQHNGTDTEYYYYNNIGNYNITASISKLDDINAINLVSTQKNDIFLVCQKLSVNNNNYSFNNCTTEYQEALNYFSNTWKNINNFPNAVNKNTRIFYEYYSLAMQGLNNDSKCFNNYGILNYIDFFVDCQIDIEKGVKNINNLGNIEKGDYLKFSKNISKSLNLKSEDLTPDFGFNSLGLKYRAVKLLLDTYVPIKTTEQIIMVNNIVNQKWNPEYPMATLDLGTYSEQDIYNIKHANEIGKALIEKNKKIEKQKLNSSQ